MEVVLPVTINVVTGQELQALRAEDQAQVAALASRVEMLEQAPPMGASAHDPFTDARGTTWRPMVPYIPDYGPGNTIVVVKGDGMDTSVNMPPIAMPFNQWHRIDLKQYGFPSGVRAVEVIAHLVSSGADPADEWPDHYAITVSAKPPSLSMDVSQYFGATTHPTGLGVRSSESAIIPCEDGEFDFAWYNTFQGTPNHCLVNVKLLAVYR